MTPVQERCDHDWECLNDWRNEIEFAGLGETLEYPVKCTQCGLEAREIYIYSGRMTNEDEEV